MRNQLSPKHEFEARLKPSVPDEDILRFEFHKHKLQNMIDRAKGPAPRLKSISRLEMIRSRSEKRS